MRNKLRKAICAGLAVTQVLSVSVFAMSDYKNDYKIDLDIPPFLRRNKNVN